MAGRLGGKVAIVTGSTTGIGKGVAKAFAREGAKVIVSGRREEAGREVVSEIQAASGDAAFCRADVGESDDLRALFGFALDTFGRLDILVNNAASTIAGSAVEVEEADWDRYMAVLLKAYYLGAKHAVPEMMKVGGGSILNLSSVHGLLAGRRNVIYGTAKAGIINLTRQLAVDFGRHDIRVNAICPGRILTENKVAWLDTAPLNERRDKLFYPLRKYGEVEDIANAALFLASDEAKFITGHALVVDGGLTAALQDGLGMDLFDDFVEAGLLDRKPELGEASDRRG